MEPRVAIVHDYLTQRGGAERVVVSMLKAFPGAPVYTSLYHADGTFEDFRRVEIRRSFLDRVAPLRPRHRLALPLLAPAFSRLRVDADVAVCSSSGWAHGAAGRARKVVYCHTPARWLYQTDRYLGDRGGAARLAVGLLGGPLRRWDRRAAGTADRYLANSTVVRDRIQAVYGIEAELLPPPPALDPEGPVRAVDGLDPGFFLCVSRLLPYKNVDAVMAAFARLPSERLVVVGAGPEADRLRRVAPANVVLAGTVEDEELRWLYARSVGIVAASYEDFGLTPLEAAAFGKPSAALRWGGFADTVVDGETGVFFDEPEPASIAAAVRACLGENWSVETLGRHAAAFSERRFVDRLRDVVASVAEEGR
jgi:glycosyltransferase involved in cell wall biosynthesis